MPKKPDLTPLKPMTVINASHESWKILDRMDETFNDLLEQVYKQGYQDGLKEGKSRKSER